MSTHHVKSARFIQHFQRNAQDYILSNKSAFSNRTIEKGLL